MTYKKTIEYLESLRPKGFYMELGPLKDACRLMGEPYEGFISVHIGGTNGKGSTAAFLSDVLIYSGYKVGLFTSPHLVDLRERIQIDRKMITEVEMTKTTNQIKAALPDEQMLSYFEILALISFLYFKAKNVDVAVFETGLGGRLDATNVITPKVSILTPISFDHMDRLGKNLTDIAKEKCGIIKRGVPTVTAYQVPEVMEVIRMACDDAGSPLCIATPDEISEPLGLAGEHQKQNAACAVEAAHLLSSAGIEIKNIEQALAKTKWPGRLETVVSKPSVILDAAHNVAGAESLASYVRSHIPKDKAVLILGILADKDIPGIIRPLAPLFREIVCVRAPSDRAASPKDLAAAARSSGAKIEITESTSDAIRKLTKIMKKDETLVISGSLTVIGEAKGYFSKK